ncbi:MULTISPECIES: hypothetical protein [unclassified Cryobacterium]|uniref:hypothetical protein n=1 Tax=unclassified Cryobacterium TaxID=2649013 RepID=UPI000CE33392|nr:MULTISPECIES: hypothetical protein [unclassified Cryobacterium]
MIDADLDSMRSSGGQFAEELAEAGAEVDCHVLLGTFHAFLNHPLEPSFTDGICLIIDWARETVGTDSVTRIRTSGTWRLPRGAVRQECIAE